jgi:hypothetical protein
MQLMLGSYGGHQHHLGLMLVSGSIFFAEGDLYSLQQWI